MSAILSYKGTVYPWHCDHMGHMNVMWYVGKFDEATWHLFARLGLTPAVLREGRQGMAAVQQNIAYKRELMAGDIVEVESRILEIREKVIRFSMRCEMPPAARSQRAARSPPSIWTGSCANHALSRRRSARRRKRFCRQ